MKRASEWVNAMVLNREAAGLAHSSAYDRSRDERVFAEQTQRIRPQQDN